MTPFTGKYLYVPEIGVYIDRICLILGYPMAMIIARRHFKRNLMVLLFVLPMWMNFLLRTYAWMTLLGKTGHKQRVGVFQSSDIKPFI